MLRRIVLTLLVATALPAAAQDDERPKNVILLIPDGAGPAAFTLARRVLDRPLALDPHLGGTVATASSSNEVTGSAASTTAYACGLRTYHGAIGVDPEGRPCRTFLEEAEAQGLATGLVTTAEITDATPAAFAAHVPNRSDHSTIAEQLLRQGIEVLMGGGARRFLPEPEGLRDDGRDLLAEARSAGYTVITAPQALAEASAPLLGLFSIGVMDYELDRDPTQEPSLAAMTEKALDVLSASPDGFFLLIETEGTDDGGHTNDPAALAREIESVDAVARIALDFAAANGETLVLVLADHETGGLTLGQAGTYHWWPEAVRGQTRSIRWMQRRIAEGGDPLTTFRSATGIDSLSVEEQAQIGAASTRHEYGLAFSAVLSSRAGVAWSTRGHTAIDVNLYRFGPGSARLTGHMTNAAFGRALFELMGFPWREPGSSE